jgi:hypothetical protein
LKHTATPKLSKAVVVRHNHILITVEKAVKEAVKRAKDNPIEFLREILDPMSTTLEIIILVFILMILALYANIKDYN